MYNISEYNPDIKQAKEVAVMKRSVYKRVVSSLVYAVTAAPFAAPVLAATANERITSSVHVVPRHVEGRRRRGHGRPG
jgi:hypothetical protein